MLVVLLKPLSKIKIIFLSTSNQEGEILCVCPWILLFIFSQPLLLVTNSDLIFIILVTKVRFCARTSLPNMVIVTYLRSTSRDTEKWICWFIWWYILWCGKFILECIMTSKSLLLSMMFQKILLTVVCLSVSQFTVHFWKWYSK